MESLIPEFQDQVRNKNSGVQGIVDANYTKDGVNYIDVQAGEHMYYGMLASNWEVTSKYKEEI